MPFLLPAKVTPPNTERVGLGSSVAATQQSHETNQSLGSNTPVPCSGCLWLSVNVPLPDTDEEGMRQVLTRWGPGGGRRGSSSSSHLMWRRDLCEWAPEKAAGPAWGWLEPSPSSCLAGGVKRVTVRSGPAWALIRSARPQPHFRAQEPRATPCLKFLT